MALAIKDYVISLTAANTAQVFYHIKDTLNAKLEYGGDLIHTVTPTKTVMQERDAVEAEIKAKEGI